jgi:membrane protein
VLQRLRAMPVIGTAMRVQQRYTADAADALAAGIGFFGFLSLVPLVAVAVAVGGLLLRGDELAQLRLAETIQQSVPALGALAGESEQLRLLIASASDAAGGLLSWGIALALFGGLRVVAIAQAASVVVFRVPRPSGVRARLEQLMALVVIAVIALTGAALGGTAGVDIGNGIAGVGRSVALLSVALVLDVVLFLVAYRLLTPGVGPAWRVLLPGSVLAGTGWSGLKLFGTSYITSRATQQGGESAAIGGVIGILLIFYLAGRLYLYGAELAAVLAGIDAPPIRAVGDAAAGGAAAGGADASEVGVVGVVGDVDARRRPAVSPRPMRDEPPSPADAAKLAVAGVTLTAAAAAMARMLRRR